MRCDLGVAARLILPIAALLLLPGDAFAQGNPGPFGGLFGRTPNRGGGDYKLFELRGSAGAQWDNGLFEQGLEPEDPTPAGVGGRAAAGAAFEQQSSRFNMRAGSNVEYQQTLAGQLIGGTSADGGLQFTSRVTTRVTLDAAVSYRYSPYFQYHPSFVWLGNGLVVPGLPHVATAIDNHTGEGLISGSFQYSRSSSVSANVSHHESRFPTSPESDVATTYYRGLWRRRLNRDFSLRLGYGQTRVHYKAAGAGDLIHEEIEAGVDFNRALTLSPRTTMAFTTSTSVLRPADDDPHYRLNGSFTLSRRFRRTWEASFNAYRGTEFIAGFVEPLFSDTLSLAVSGLLADRVEWTTMVNGIRGEVGFDSAHGRFMTAGAITQLNFAMTRHVGIYSQYGFYRHDVPSEASSIAVRSQMSRQTFSAGITAWVPVFTRGRATSDSR